MNKNRIIIYYYTFFKNFFNKYILTSRKIKMRLLEPKYRKKNLGFWYKKLKEEG